MNRTSSGKSHDEQIAANLHDVAEAILDAEQGCGDPTSEYVSWRSLANLARIALDAPTDSRQTYSSAYLFEEIDRLRDALEKIATPKRLDGTYNLSREACEEIAREALRRGDT